MPESVSGRSAGVEIKPSDAAMVIVVEGLHLTSGDQGHRYHKVNARQCQRGRPSLRPTVVAIRPGLRTGGVYDLSLPKQPVKRVRSTVVG